MEAVALGETPRSLEVLREVVDLLDGVKDRAVDRLLLRLLLLGEGLLLLALTEELSLLGVLARLGLGEVSVVDGLGDLDGGDVDLGRGGNNVSLRDAAKGNAVQPVLLAWLRKRNFGRSGINAGRQNFPGRLLISEDENRRPQDAYSVHARPVMAL